MMGKGIEGPMSGGEANSAHEPAATQGATSAPQRPFVRTIVALRRIALLAGGGAALGLVLGFLGFLARVPAPDAALDRRAEGIVVLTGGAARISDAIELLAAGRGHRLLITGVNPATHTVELARLAPHYEQLFGCCIDLDHSAVNTIGNAIETRRWTRARGFRSLLVVTSAYHMPRAIAELAHQLPDVTLIEFPVLTERQRAEPWWSNEATARLVISEYLKFVYAFVRMHIAAPQEQSRVVDGACGVIV
jgi:uncharacterized SAM-binding protein YcdF (DUF218 family)